MKERKKEKRNRERQTDRKIKEYIPYSLSKMDLFLAVQKSPKPFEKVSPQKPKNKIQTFQQNATCFLRKIIGQKMQKDLSFIDLINDF